MKRFDSEGGNTLLELLVVFVLFAILSESAIHGVLALQNSIEKNTSRQQLEFVLRRARNDALANGARVILTVSSSGDTLSLGLDKYPYSSALTPDSTFYTARLPDGVSLSTNHTIVFSSAGNLIDASGNLTTITASLSESGSTFLSGTVYPIGSINYN